MESADQIYEKELDLNGSSIPQDEYVQAFSMYSMIENFASPWENEKALIFKML